ncbi:MAG: hypothetical protein DRN49_00145 [Thaumarchaeota archaeon]|nr:MAG: hypothetical protein DRN49_00145 [Nitrososphaerota archaeon]
MRIPTNSKHIHFAILDEKDGVADVFTGLRRYPSSLFILFITSNLYHTLKEKVESAVSSLKILKPELQVKYLKNDLNDYWGTFFKVRELATKIIENDKNVSFYANISTQNRVAAMAVRDALATLQTRSVCYYFKRGEGEEEMSEIIEVPIPPSHRDISKVLPILKTLYERGGKADSIEEIAKEVGRILSKSRNFDSQARLVEYYVKKLEVYAIVRVTSGRRKEVRLTGVPLLEARMR